MVHQNIYNQKLNIMKKLITLLFAILTFSAYSQEMVQYNGRMFTKSQPMTVEPAWSSKFVTGDLLLCTYDSIIYQCNAISSVKRVWNPLYSIKRIGGGVVNPPSGTGIDTAYINNNGNLIITYSDGNTQDAGHVVGKDGQQGLQGLQGVQGAKGDKGDVGQQGIQGVKGDAGAKGEKGDKGDAGVAGANAQNPNFSVSAMSASTPSASVSGTYPNLNILFGIPSGGASASAMYYLSPDAYGAVHNNTTFAQAGKNQSYINANYPNTGATVNDYIDWAAWQMAVNQAEATGQPVWAFGKYWVNKSISVSKTNYNLTIYGNYCTITAIGGGYAVLKRVQPTDNSEALNILVNARFNINSVIIVGEWTNTGMDLGASYGAYYNNCRYDGLGVGLWLKFALNTMVVNCYATNCNKGFIADCGDWSGASYLSANAQSNHTKFIGCRAYCSTSSTFAFGVYGCSGVLVESCIIEGKKVVNGIDFDGKNCSAVKDFTVASTHFECEQGAENAFVKFRIREGILTIDKSFGQYPAVLLDAGSQAGDVFCFVGYTGYWVAKNGKIFNNAGSVNYILRYNDSPLKQKSGINGYFSGTAVHECTGSGCGLNTYTWIGLPSFQ